MLASVRQARGGKCSTGLDALARRVVASRSSCSMFEMVSDAVILFDSKAERWRSGDRARFESVFCAFTFNNRREMNDTDRVREAHGRLLSVPAPPERHSVPQPDIP